MPRSAPKKAAARKAKKKKKTEKAATATHAGNGSDTLRILRFAKAHGSTLRAKYKDCERIFTIMQLIDTKAGNVVVAARQIGGTSASAGRRAHITPENPVLRRFSPGELHNLTFVHSNL